MSKRYFCYEQLEKPFGPFDLIEISEEEFTCLQELSGNYQSEIFYLNGAICECIDVERYTGATV